MKKILVLLVLLGVVGGGVYYYDPGLLGLDAPAKVTKKKGKKKKKSAKAAKKTDSAEESAVAAQSEEKEEMVAEPAASPLSFPDNLEARAKAKAEGRPCLIVWHGSDWLPNAGKVVKEWTKLQQKNLPVVLGQIDERVGAIPTLDERKKLIPYGEFMNLPVALLMAPDESLLGIYTGKTVLSAAAMEKAVQGSLKLMPKYMELVEKARTTDGVEGAKAAGEALAMLPYVEASRNYPLKDILNRKDPQNETMYRYLYCMDHMGMYDEINAVLNGGKGADAKYKDKERRFDEGIQFVQKVMKAHKMNTELQQQWTSGLAYAYREKYKATNEPALRKKLVETYRKVVEIDSGSEYGKGAQRWADYWDDSVPYVFDEHYYDSGEMTFGIDKEWRVNVSEQVSGPGSYTFSLVPSRSKNGRLSTKGFQLYANDKHVCDADVPADQDTKTVNFNVPRALKGKVEVRFRAQCFDGWYNCAGEMVMKKN